MKLKYLLFIFPVLIITLCFAGRIKDKPVNLIIFIGDGMGTSQIYAAMTASGSSMTFPSFPVSGFSITSSFDDYITDSAAGGTALSTGEKTNNGMLAVRPDSTVLETIMELAKKKGLSTGIISTSSLTDATPASFIAHVNSRADYEDIAKFYTNGTADVFIGGGKNNFVSRKDNQNLAEELKKKGYDVVYNIGDLKKSASSHIAGIMADEDMPYVLDGRDTSFLADATSKAIAVLSRNKKGFVLMVEGSEIDFGGHANNLPVIIAETIDLDRAVRRACTFAKSNNNTLVVVTADHETGGLTLTGGNVEKKSVEGNFASGNHSAVMVPVFAFGPGSLNFAGIHQNTYRGNEFINLLSLRNKK